MDNLPNSVIQMSSSGISLGKREWVYLCMHRPLTMINKVWLSDCTTLLFLHQQPIPAMHYLYSRHRAKGQACLLKRGFVIYDYDEVLFCPTLRDSMQLDQRDKASNMHQCHACDIHSITEMLHTGLVLLAAYLLHWRMESSYIRHTSVCMFEYWGSFTVVLLSGSMYWYDGLFCSFRIKM